MKPEVMGIGPTAKMIHALRTQGGKYGMVTMCIGAWMGAAVMIEIL